MDNDVVHYLDNLAETVKREQQVVREIEQGIQQVQDVKDVLVTLPDTLRPKVMVPYSKHAFFPGHLMHTNEITVNIGGGLHAEVSAKDAIDILARRQGRAQRGIQRAQAHIQELQEKAAEVNATFANEHGDDFMEIRQDFDESEALLEEARAREAAAQQARLAAAIGLSGSASGTYTTQDTGTANASHAQLHVGLGPQSRQSSSSSRKSGKGSAQRGNDDHGDDAIFARLAELERLEAEAAAREDEDEVEVEADGQAGPGVSTSSAAAKAAAAGPLITAAGRPAVSAAATKAVSRLASSSSSSSNSSKAAGAVVGAVSSDVTAASAAPAANSSSGAKPAAKATPLKKGFFVKSSSPKPAPVAGPSRSGAGPASDGAAATAVAGAAMGLSSGGKASGTSSRADPVAAADKPGQHSHAEPSAAPRSVHFAAGTAPASAASASAAKPSRPTGKSQAHVQEATQVFTGAIVEHSILHIPKATPDLPQPAGLNSAHSSAAMPAAGVKAAGPHTYGETNVGGVLPRSGGVEVSAEGAEQPKKVSKFKQQMMGGRSA